MMPPQPGLTDLRIQLAASRDALRHAKDTLALTQAEAEQRAIDIAGGQIGKNEAERTRALTLALSRDSHYRAALTQVRVYEAEVDRLDALLEGAKDARRIEEWTIRARLADALDRHGLPSTPDDAVFDDVSDAHTLGVLPF